MVTDTDDSDSGNIYIVMSQLIYLDDSNDEESLSNPSCMGLTLYPVTQSENPTKEPTSEPDYDALSELSAPLREDSIGHLSPKDIVKQHKGSDPPIFATPEERTKEAHWGDTRKSGSWAKMRAWRQEKTS